MSLVMFDYDGVIVDSYARFVEDWTRACRACGLEIRSHREILSLFDDNVYASMRRSGVEDATIDRILELYKATGNFTEVGLFSGMADALTQIAARNRVVVITSNLSPVVREVLERHHLRCVEEVIGAEYEKSKTKKIAGVIAGFPGLVPYYVGDTKGDLIEAREAGARTVAVTWGWHDADRLRTVNPDYIVDTPAELVTLFNEGGGSRVGKEPGQSGG